MSWLSDIIDPRVQQAIIAGLFVAIGWVYSSGQKRRTERRLRRIRRHDLQTALLAEILHYREALEFFDLDETWTKVVLRMERDPSFHPFIPSERNATIFTASLEHIHILPGAVIGPVTRYYNQVFAIDALIADMHGEAFAAQEQSVRISVYTDYIALKKEALIAAREASEALSAKLEKSDIWGRRVPSPVATGDKAISSPAAARSDQS